MSAFLEGLVGGASSVQAFGQQQFENKRRLTEFDESVRQYDQSYALAQDNYKLNKRQTKINEDGNSRSNALQPGKLEKQGLDIEELSLKNNKAKKDVVYGDNDRLFGKLTAAGFLNPELGPAGFDMPQAIKNIVEGGAVNDSIAFQMLQKDADIPEGFKWDLIDRTNPNGLIISGTYKDGTKGVLTEDGRISNDSAVALLSPQVIAGLMDDEYQTNIRGNSNLGGSDATMDFLLAQGMGRADAEELVKRKTAQATIATAVIGELEIAADDPATGDEKNVGMVRQFKGLLASAETSEEKLQILLSQAETMGIEVPEILTTPAPVAPNGEPAADPEAAARTSTNNIFEDQAERYSQVSEPSPENDLENDLDTQIKDLEQRMANAPPLARPALRQRLDRLKAQKPAQPDVKTFTAIPNQTDDAKAAAASLEAGIFGSIKNMNPAEVITFAESNDFEITKEDEQNLSKVLQQAEVNTAADISKLPSGAQINVRAWLYATAKQTGDTPAAEKIRQEISNLGSGGTVGMTAGEERDLQNKTRDSLSKQQAARTGVYTAQTGRMNSLRQRDEYYLKLEQQDYTQGDETGLKIVESMQQIDKGLYELNDDGEPTEVLKYDQRRLRKALVGPDGALTKLQRQLKNASAQNRPQIRSAVNSTYSIAIQAMAESEEYGTFGEILPDGAIDFIDGNDKFLSRVFIAERDTKGDPMRFGIRSLSSATQTEETISASVIKNTFGNQGYADFRQELGKRRKARAQDDKIKQTGIGK